MKGVGGPEAGALRGARARGGVEVPSSGEGTGRRGPFGAGGERGEEVGGSGQGRVAGGGPGI